VDVNGAGKALLHPMDCRAIPTGHSASSADPQVPVRRQQQPAQQVQFEQQPESFAVVAKQADFGAYKNEALCFLGNREYGEVRKAVFLSVIAELVDLSMEAGAMRSSRQQQQ